MAILNLLQLRSNGQIIQADTDNNEWLNIIRAVNGTDTDKNLITRFSGTDPVYVLDQLSSGRILELRKSGAARAFFGDVGNLNIVHGDFPGIILTNTDAAKSLVVTVLDSGLAALGFTVGGSEVGTINLTTGVITFTQAPILPVKPAWSMNWFIADPSTYPLNSFNLAQKVSIPANSGGFRAQFGRGIFNTGSASGSFSVEIRKHPFSGQGSETTLGTITTNPGTLGVGQGSVLAIDHTFTADDFVYIKLTARSSPLQRDVTISLTGTQTPTVP